MTPSESESHTTPGESDESVEPVNVSKIERDRLLFYLAGEVPIAIQELAKGTKQSAAELRDFFYEELQNEVDIDSTGFVRLKDGARTPVIRASKPYIRTGQERFEEGRSSIDQNSFDGAIDHLSGAVEIFEQIRSRFEAVNYASDQLEQRIKTSKNSVKEAQEAIEESENQDGSLHGDNRLNADSNVSPESSASGSNSDDRDALLQIIDDLYTQLGRVPKTTDLPEECEYSTYDFYSEFGSWDEALGAAGIDKEQALLDDIQQVAEKLGRAPKSTDMDEHGTYSGSAFSSYFDSWSTALERSGLEESRNEKLLETIRSLHNRLDRLPKTTDLYDVSGVSQHDYIRNFGSWDEALEAAGIDKGEHLIDDLKQVAAESGGIPGTKTYNECGKYSSSMHGDYFGSWDAALEAAGLSPRKQELLETLQSLQYRLDRLPKEMDLDNVSDISRQEFYEVFGKWDEALEAADLDKKQALLDDIERVAEEQRCVPTPTDMNEYGIYSGSDYSQYFRSWTAALTQSGVEQSGSGEVHRKKLLKMLRSLYGRLGQLPKATNLQEVSGVNQKDIYNEFGSLDEALEAAGIDKEQALLDDLHQVAEKLNHVPTPLDMDEYGTYSADYHIRYFSSWSTALEQSGVAEVSEEMLLQTLKSLQHRLNRIPKKSDLYNMSGISQYDFYKEFGSWDEALEAAGINKEQALLDDIELVAEKLNRVPTPLDIDKHGRYSAGFHSQYFGSWSTALDRSGCDANHQIVLLETLRPLHNRLDRVPKPTDLQDVGGITQQDVYKEFGSWDEALEAAGIDKEQALLDDIEQVAEKLNHVPTLSDMDEHGRYLGSYYSTYFSSWSTALERSDVKKVSEEGLLETLRSLHNRLDRVPKPTDLQDVGGITQQDVYKEFGSWDEALEAAGIDKEQALLDDIEQVAEKLNHVPTLSDMDKYGGYSGSYYSTYFGSWNTALERSNVPKVTEEELLNTLRSLHTRLNRLPNEKDLDEVSNLSQNDLYKLFESWDTALAAAGIDIEQALLDDIERVADKLGRPPKLKDMSEYGTYSTQVYSQHLGSWNTALERSGVTEDYEKKLVETLQSLHNQLDRLPKESDLDDVANLSQEDYNRHFGGWVEALEAAGIDKEQHLIDALRQVAAEINDKPRMRDANVFGDYSAGVYKKHFGSWDAALEAAGLSSENSSAHIESEMGGDTESAKMKSSELSTPAADSETLQDDKDADSEGILNEITDEFEDF